MVVGLGLPLEGGVGHQTLGDTDDSQPTFVAAAVQLDNHHTLAADASEHGLPVVVAAAGSTVPSVPAPFVVEPIKLL